MLLGTALGGPGGQKALLSRRFKGNLGNFRKSGNDKNGRKKHQTGDFEQILETPSTLFSVGNREKLRKVARGKLKKQKNTKIFQNTFLATY